VKTSRQAVADAISQAIASGELLPGAKLPAERELAEKHSASRETVRAALHMLAETGQVTSVKGSGWFVRKLELLRYPLHSIDAGRASATVDVWDRFVLKEGRTAGNELIVNAVSIPPERVRLKLDLEPGEPAVERRRIRLVDREPWMISTGWWPRWIAAGTLIEEPHQCSPLKIALELGHGQHRSENEVAARMPTADETAVLKTGRGIPVMDMLTTGWDADGRALRCTSDVFPAHRFLLVFEHDWSNER
jgi:DNA-binding GntR family transcriptional regulator